MAFLSMHRRLPIGSSAVLKGRGLEQPRPNFLLLFTRGVEVACPETQAMVSVRFSPYTVRTGNALKERFWATMGEKPEVELALV